MKHKTATPIRSARFIPFEDVLGLTTDEGYNSIVIPGSGDPHFDAWEANPFESSKQRKEGLVKNLLEKLHPDSISLRINTIGKVDDATLEVKQKEKREEEEAAIAEMNKKDKKRIKKMRGKMKDGHVQEVKVQHQLEAMREKNKLAYLKEFRKAKE